MPIFASDPARGWGVRLRDFFFLDHRPGRHVAMEGLRGYAVLLVVFLHSVCAYLVMSGSIGPFDMGPITETSKRYGWGVAILHGLCFAHFAVDLFFLLSAFLIMRVVAREQNNFRYGPYLWKRFWRIYPTFLATLAFAIWVQTALCKVMPLRWTMIGYQALLLNGVPSYGLRVMSYNAPTWSLFYEFAFYISFPLAFGMWKRTKRGPDGASFFCLTLLLASICLIYSYVPRAIAFVFGCVIGGMSDRDLRAVARSLPEWLVAALYVGATSAFCYTTKSGQWFVPAFSFVASLLVVKTCFGEGLLNRFFSLLPMRFVGNISYSLYLSHSAFLMLIIHYLKPFSWGLGRVTGSLALFTVTTIVSVAGSVVLFALVERLYFRRKAPRPVEAPATGPRLAA